jgi:hypothetical protein
MATIAGHRLTLDPSGKCSNAFSSEIANQTESKLDKNFPFLGCLVSIVQVVLEKKRFETFFP